MEVEITRHKSLKCDPTDKIRPEFKPQEHQLRVVREFLESKKRGLLFYHALGSGKTCAAYLAIDAYRRLKEKRRVYIIAPASLASSHKKQYCDVCGESPEKFEFTFRFYSYNDRQGIAKKLPRDLNDSIILVDEVQEILNGKQNSSESLSKVYDTILRAKNAKVIILSGTPCFTPHQASLLMNLLDPGIVSMNETAFKEDSSNEHYLYLKFRGLISYVPVPDESKYPRHAGPRIEEYFEMSKYQYETYLTVRGQELDRMKVTEDAIKLAMRRGDHKQVKKLKALKYMQSTNLLSRQICNFAYPPEAKKVAKVSDKNAKWILEGGMEVMEKLGEYSPKMKKLIERCLSLPGKHMVYGWYKTSYGLHLIYTFLKHCGISPLIFSGDTGNDQQRAALIDKFNAVENARGEINKVILVSGAGAMGISLFGIRHFHNFEAGLNEFISFQAEGRAFRTMSHAQLPKEEWTVQVYRYFSCNPKTGKYEHHEDLSTEEMAYIRGKRKMENTVRVLDIMKRAAFDCSESYNSAIRNCYVYGPEDNYFADYNFEGDDPFQNDTEDNLDEPVIFNEPFNDDVDEPQDSPQDSPIISVTPDRHDDEKNDYHEDSGDDDEIDPDMDIDPDMEIDHDSRDSRDSRDSHDSSDDEFTIKR